ncbi:MAG TPA: hypothetical protein VK327_01285 [Candidatus Paceibacterota bacterium]|nr:hypothetical protein [Candidatus Paceibacterota bacterium]
MGDIPEAIFDRVRELAVALTNASAKGDDLIYASHLESLRSFFEDLETSDQSHPFVTEALADYTLNSVEAIRLYKLAIMQSEKFPEEPIHTKMISLAGCLRDVGQTEQAQAYLRDGRARSVLRADVFWIEEADKLLKKFKE